MLFLGYFSLGLLIGIITGITSSPIATAIIASVFTFVGGAITIGIDKVKFKREMLGGILFCFSIACLIGILTGIYIKENRLLTSVERHRELSRVLKEKELSPYMKGIRQTDIDSIHSRYLSENQCDRAYKELRGLLLMKAEK